MTDKVKVLMQSKQLVHTSYELTAVENRVFYHLLFSAQKEKNGIYSCTLKLSELQNLINNNNEKKVESVKKMLEALKGTSLIFEHVDDSDTIECDYSLVSAIEHNITQNEFKLIFLERIYEHIVKYSVYAPLNLAIISKFSSFYAQRIYELLRLWSKTGEVIEKEFRIEQLRFICASMDKYPQYKNFKQRVINQAVKEIQQHGNMEVDFKEIKEGRKVSKIKFIVLDHEPKVYFKNKKKNLIDDKVIEGVNFEVSEASEILKENIESNLHNEEEILENKKTTSDVERTEVAKINKWVNLPESLIEDKYLLEFLNYCLTNMIDFSAEYFNSILVESLDETYRKKGEGLIGSKGNSFKYFFAVFKNKYLDYENKMNEEISKSDI
ncbi:replication initiation protein [Clostridium massiliamazoniense]|uniref:replication initiation protein n=1 Tax=Clostridium massiliamazoniense TaxID=1347366 RepID=UPI0006D7784F|nr:replication initiation protein [Clostridium massiliamazoniense]